MMNNSDIPYDIIQSETMESVDKYKYIKLSLKIFIGLLILIIILWLNS